MAKPESASCQEKKAQRGRKGRQATRKYSLAEWFGFANRPSPAWGRIARKYRRNPALKGDTICAMPEPFVNAIQLELPDFFSKREEQFERDLARMAGNGFFLRHTFGYPPIKGSTSGDATDERLRKLAKRRRESDQKIKQMLVEDLEQHGRSPARIQEHFATKNKIADKIEARKWGYAGWLVTDPTFRKECSEFRSSCEEWIRAIGGFPAYPTNFMGHSPVVPKPIREFYDFYTQFYQRWCIHTFVTWELPIPMWAGIATPVFYPLAQVSEAGMALFMPWYLLRDQTFKLQDLAKHERFAKGPDHLQGWFKRDRNRWGHERLGMMLKLYICYELCLKRRYADRLDGTIEKLDSALGHFLSDAAVIGDSVRYKEDSVEKIRKEMHKRLSSCPIPEDSDKASAVGNGSEAEACHAANGLSTSDEHS